MAIESQISEEAEGDFTSMIDVVFLLLIFFILQPFKDPDMRVLAYLPKNMGSSSSSSPEELTPPISLRIVAQGKEHEGAVYFLDEDRVDDGDYLAGTLASKTGGDTKVPINVTPSPRVRFKYVLKALDQCAMVNMEKVNFTAGF